MNESRILRDRLASTQAALELIPSEPPDCSAAILAETTYVNTYPTTANVFYACYSCELSGNESEGAAATYVHDSSAVFYAYNLGTTVPPVGSHVVCHAVGGRWCFRWDS
jgi:hypothetical protein